MTKTTKLYLQKEYQELSDRTYLVVFHGKWHGQRIVDIGDDPCFDFPPTWGICRPPTRRSIRIGDTLFFLAKIETEYYLKGWFKVGEKVDYLTAMNRFPTRQNIMLSRNKSPRKNEWRYKELKKEFILKHGNVIPRFLLRIKCKEGTFYQNPSDDHQLDNWKCRRIFHCQSKHFRNCISNNSCLKDGETLSNYKNYIVADPNKWDNVETLRITLDDIRTATGFNKPVRTPYNQHHVQKFDNYRDKMAEYIQKRKRS